MQTAIFTASAAAQQQKQQQQQQQQQSTVQDNHLGNGVSIVNATPRERDNSRTASPNPAAALLKSQNELTIKNEIVISPSPSPEPIISVPTNGTAASPLAVVTKSTNISVLQAKRLTQRLEEVN